AADARRLRLCRGVRRRAQVPRDAALSDRADLDQFDPVLPRRARPRPAAVVLSSCSTGKTAVPACRRSNRLGRRWLSLGVAAMRTTLVADIGGSKSRFALAPSAGAVERVLGIENDTGADLDAAGARQLQGGRAGPRRAAAPRGDAGRGRPGRRRGDRTHQSGELALAAARIRQALWIFTASRAE